MRHVRGIDGRVVQVEGEISADIVARDGQSLHFDAPVMSRLTGSGLHVAGGNRPEHVFPISDVSHVQVNTIDEGLTQLAITLPICVAAGLGGLVAALVVLN
ncbi:MAG: hypothetical protein AB8I08_02840 [Sandaracinaceae bacterium]